MWLNGDVVQMNDRAVGQLSGLAGRLVAEGLITVQEAGDAQKDAARESLPFVQYLVEKKSINSQRLAEVASHEFGVPLFGDSVVRPGLGDVEPTRAACRPKGDERDEQETGEQPRHRLTRSRNARRRTRAVVRVLRPRPSGSKPRSMFF